MRTSVVLTLAAACALAGCNNAPPEKLPDDNMVEVENLTDNADVAVVPPVANVTEPANATVKAAPAPGFTEEQQMKDDADATGMTARLPDETPATDNETAPAK